MKKITFHFFSNSPLIKLRFGTPITHVGIEFEDGTYMESLMIKGNVKTHVKNMTRKPKFSLTIEVEEGNYIKARGKANNIIGKRYDYKAILGFILGIKMQGNNDFFCSEFGRIVFENATGVVPNLDRLCTPYDLYLIIQMYLKSK